MNQEQNAIPRHIAIIMDGNGRWATERGQERTYGHKAGVDTVRRITAECVRMGVKYLTLYTFSTENWNRPDDEVSALMGLVLSSLEDEIFMKHNVRFRMIGDSSRLPVEVKQKLWQTEQRTAHNSAMTMVVALSYSSRWEITQAVRDIAEEAQKGLIRSVADIVPHKQLPAMADSLLRAIFLRHILARLCRGASAQGHRVVSAEAEALRKDRGTGRAAATVKNTITQTIRHVYI